MDIRKEGRLVELGVLGKNLEMPRWYAPPGGTGLVARRRRKGYNTVLMKRMLRVWVVILERSSSI